MKSLAALLKRDRSNSLIQAPPSAISLSSSQEPEAPLLKDRRSSTPPTFLQPPPHHRLSSSVSSFHNPLFPEPPAHPLGHASSYSTSYYSESDDNVLADPFAAGPPPKGDSTSSVSSHLGCSGAGPESTSTHSNSTHSLPPSAFRHRVVHELSPAPYSVNEPPSRSGVTTPSEKKGSWLRERRSRSSLVRSKVSVTFRQPNLKGADTYCSSRTYFQIQHPRRHRCPLAYWSEKFRSSPETGMEASPLLLKLFSLRIHPSRYCKQPLSFISLVAPTMT